MNSKPPSRTLDPGATAVRELQAAREIAHAFLNARHPAEVYRLALEKVAPLVGASFGCVFLRDQDSDLLRIVAAHNWPQAYASYLSTMRVKVGNGPTGRAVEENDLIEVEDVFADPSIEDWWDAARELGFASSVSVPLAFRSKPVGAVTFYFREPEPIHEADRSLLRLVADQLAATAEKAHLIEDLQRANELLREQNVDLEAKYQEAEEAKRLKNEFLANVSHELRTPLTAILGYAYLLREGLSGVLVEEQAEAVEKIEGAGNILMGLINDLLDLTYLKLGRTVVERELCDAVALVRAALSGAPKPAGGVEIRTEAPPARIPIHTDAVLVVRVLQKLISNAVKFTTTGTVTIRVRTRDPEAEGSTDGEAPLDRGPVVLWEVEDTGIGIAPDAQSAIFDEFRQVDGSATRRFNGAGLGLALSQGLAYRLGGEITVRSTLGEGSIFTLALPASVIHAGQGKPDDSPSTSGLAAAT
ncbi:MAG: GAF domain-containing sensor histidine kinase [Gemmatimonadetes bacterium]|nr:GAF domain-containing sensor histidine kinase [Gemmatimonadota bacterium]